MATLTDLAIEIAGDINGKRPVEPIELGSEHLDTLTTPGDYYQSSSSTASTTLGYPVGAAGSVRVTANASRSQIQQYYTRFSPGVTEAYMRKYSSAGWGAWFVMVDGTDSRLTDARTPLAHTHTQAQVTGLVDALAGKRDVAPMPIAQGTNLNDVTTPGEHSQQFTAWATPELNYPGGASPVAGRLFVAANTQRTQVTQFYVPFTTSKLDIWMRNFYVSWSAWERVGMASDLALKANADHPALYQSGVRNVAASLLAGWSLAARGVTLSRQGSTVTLSLDVTRTGALLHARSAAMEPSFAEIIPITTGFQPIMSGFIQPSKAGTGARASGWYDHSGVNLRIRDLDADIPTGTRITNVISWQTVDPIPTTLPGIPA